MVPLVDALKIPARYGVAFSVNNITGFPTETRELAMDTIELNRHIDSHNQNLYSFIRTVSTYFKNVTIFKQGMLKLASGS